MHPTTLLASTLIPLAAAAPFSFPLPNGFPTPSADQVKQIQIQAQGTLSNASAPANISADGLTNLKLIAFNEIFEVAFFTELVANITNNVPGYDLQGEHRAYTLNSLKAVIAQEELHALNANGALAKFGADPIQACQYNFPVNDTLSAINLARTATDVVLGTLQDVIQIFAKGGDTGLARAVASVVGQEGEQNGFYRMVLGQIPSELPFLTTSDRNFAFTAIQSFVVPGSCPNINTIPLTTFAGLNVVGQPSGTQDDTLTFTFDANAVPGYSATNLFVTYINQQNVPVTLPVTQAGDSTGTVTALFPFTEHLMNGMTIATLTSSAGPFSSASDVAKATIFGPAFLFAN